MRWLRTPARTLAFLGSLSLICNMPAGAAIIEANFQTPSVTGEVVFDNTGRSFAYANLGGWDFAGMIVAEVFTDASATMIGEALYIVDADDTAACEFAIAVADWQGMGLGQRIAAA